MTLQLISKLANLRLVGILSHDSFHLLKLLIQTKSGLPQLLQALIRILLQSPLDHTLKIDDRLLSLDRLLLNHLIQILEYLGLQQLFLLAGLSRVEHLWLLEWELLGGVLSWLLRFICVSPQIGPPLSCDTTWHNGFSLRKFLSRKRSFDEFFRG